MIDFPTAHRQIPYTTRAGVETTIDENLEFVMMYLRDYYGVETKFSCQGGEFSAYVSASAPAMIRLIKKVLKTYRRGQLRFINLETVARFLTGAREIDVAWRIPGQRVLRQRRYGHLHNEYQEYSVELVFTSWSSPRIVIRWPVGQTWRIESLLMDQALLAS